MALLSDPVRQLVAAEFGRRLSRRNDPTPLQKADVQAAVNALDGFLDQNATAINNAFPLAARTQLTTAQKNELLTLVAKARWGGND